MSTNLVQYLSAVAIVVGGLSAEAQDSAVYVQQRVGTSVVVGTSFQFGMNFTAQCRFRHVVVSGGRVTLCANFLRDEEGVVLLLLNGTSQECKLVKWSNRSVTVDLPKLGLECPKDASLQIALPDGRIAKTFKVLYVPQPDLLIHRDSIPRPTPPIQVGPGQYSN